MSYITFQPSDHFNTKLYTGTGSSMSVTGVGFRPDWLWIKTRNATNASHIVDVVRGNGQAIASDLTNAQYSSGVTSFDSDGFSLVGNTGAVNNGNGSTTYASWNWKANGAGSSNTDGSITSTVSASTTSGFSIVKYTGNGTDGGTIGHGLSQAPEIVIFKDLSSGASWATFGYPNNSAFSADGSHVLLDSNSAMSDSETKEVSLSSSTITLVDAGGDIGASGDDYVAYCFHSVKGFSRMGSYFGNGNGNGPMIYTGFKPAFVMIKYIAPSGGVGDWNMYDSKRLGQNGKDAALFANLTNSEASDYGRIDFLSNGFKLRTTNSQLNELGSGSSYVYMAFAEEPLVSSNELPATAR